MFKKEYQGGAHVEVFSAQGRDPVSQWRLVGGVRKEYHKAVRGYVYCLEGGSSSTSTRMQFPRSDKATLHLLQPCCVFQLLVPTDARLAIDLSITDGGGSRRRVQLSSSLRELSASPLNARIPLAAMKTGQWLNLCLDLQSLVSGLFKGQEFKSLESISLGGSCLLRRVFTLRSTSEDVPRACQMPPAVGTVETQVLGFEELTSTQSSSSPERGKGDSSEAPPPSAMATRPPTHVAFGSKVAIPDHVIQARKGSGGSSRSGANQGVRGEWAESLVSAGNLVVPRPPSERPVDPALLHIQKKRIRVIRSKGGRRTEREPDTVEPAVSRPAEMTPSLEVFQLDARALKTSSPVHHLHDSDDAMQTLPPDLDSDEQLAVDVLQQQSVEGGGGGGGGRDSSFMDSMEETGPGEVCSSPSGDVGGSSVDTTAEGTELDSTLDDSDLRYSYKSLPKSASGRRHTDTSPPVLDDVSGGRGAGLDEDFMPPGDSSQDSADGVEVSDVHQLSETRLSDDYDWRLYASQEEGEGLAQSDMSLRARLAAAGAPPSSPPLSSPHTLIHGVGHSGSSEMDNTLSGSLTLSSAGWTERYRDAAKNPLLDSLDVREMGGALSPAVGMLTQQSDLGSAEDEEGEEEEGGGAGGGELELMYDPQLNCFYDPNTYKYYELIQ